MYWWLYWLFLEAHFFVVQNRTGTDWEVKRLVRRKEKLKLGRLGPLHRLMTDTRIDLSWSSSFMAPCVTSFMFSSLKSAKLPRTRSIISVLRSVLAVLYTKEKAGVFSKVQAFIKVSLTNPVVRRRSSLRVVYCTSDYTFSGLIWLITLANMNYHDYWCIGRRLLSLRNGRHETLRHDSMYFCAMARYSFCEGFRLQYFYTVVEGGDTPARRRSCIPRFNVVCSDKEGDSRHSPVRYWQDPCAVAWSELRQSTSSWIVSDDWAATFFFFSLMMTRKSCTQSLLCLRPGWCLMVHEKTATHLVG